MTKVRLWPLILVLALVAAALVNTWVSSTDSSEEIRQSKVMLSTAILVLGALASLLWALLLSRLPVRRRFGIGAGFLVVGLAFAALFRFRGVSGDLVPQFELRFRSSSTDLGELPLSSLPGSADYPQFLGPSRDGVLPPLAFARDWTAAPPRVVWRRPVGGGWSGFSVSGNSAVTQEQHSAEERVVSYELSTGQVQWASREVAHYTNALAGEGPRATPTIADGRVHALGGTGILTTLDLEKGELLWKRDILKDGGAELPLWGKSDSPLVWNGLVIVSAGGPGGSSLVAYNAEDGEIVWRGGDDRSGYASPILVTFDGVPQIVSFNHDAISAHDPESGDVLWRQPWPSNQPNVSQPLPLPGDRFLASAGYGVGAKVFQVRRDGSGEFATELVWESPRLKSKFANLVFYEGFVYGLDDGIFVCIDPADGRRRWKNGRYGHGQILLVGDVLLVQSEHGELILVEPNPDELTEITRASVMNGKIWNPPALAGRYLLMRNDAEAVLVELPVVG